MKTLTLLLMKSALMILSLTGSIQAQTWVTNWTDTGTALTTSDGGTTMTADFSLPAASSWLGSSTTFASGGLSSETGSYTTIQSDGLLQITFSLPTGHVFSGFKLVETKGDDTPIVFGLGSGSWSLQEVVNTGSGVATISGGGTDLNDLGSYVAVASVNGLNSFTMTISEQTEDSTIGFAYASTPVPEPSSTALLGLSGFMLIIRKRG